MKRRNVCAYKFTRYGIIISIILFILFLFFNLLMPHHHTLGRRKVIENFNKEISNKDELRQLKYRNLVKESQNVVKEEPNVNCEIIHVGFVCSGYKSNFYLHTLLKSIFFYRISPIHFHILSNKFSENVLKTLFRTWDVPQTNVTFYDLNDSILDIRWVPNSHYSGIYGLMKLVFPKIVPSNITKKLIVLDTDLTFASDIYQLWNIFNNFSHSQAIGIVENQSDYYLGKNSKTKPWPAINRGFNSGVLLYHLERLKRLNWSKLWVNVAKNTARIYGATRLGDQDIINAVIAENADIVYQVPCYWNTQLSDHTLSSNCYRNHRVRIVHWNSPRKVQVINKDGDYFRSLFTTFVEYNGNLLRKQLYYCDNALRNVTEPTADQCVEFRRAQTGHWRTLLFFRDYEHTPTEYDVTFVAQLSYDRLQMVEDLVKYWSGPISLTLYVTDPEFQECNNFIDNSELLLDRTNIAYHAVFKDGEYYPINLLRNVGLHHVETPYVFLADIDFLPMRGSYSTLKSYLMSLKDTKLKTLIVPAFESQRYRTRLPKNKGQLLQMLDGKTMFPFRLDVWQPGHAPTNYTKWKTATSPYKVKWEPDFEPYIVVRRDVTEYDSRFMGFGWNKVSHIMELEAQGYEFIVLPNVFIIHKPHAPSYDIAKFRASPIYRMCLQNLKEEFVQSLSKKYGRAFDNRNNSFAPFNK